MVKTTVLYDKDHDPNKEEVRYVAIDTNRMPSYVMETYSLTREQIDGIRQSSPDSVLIENVDIARKLFDFQSEEFSGYELESEIDKLEKVITNEEIDKKKHSNWAFISSLPLVYLFGKEFYDFIAVNDPINFERPVDLIIGVTLGSIFFSSLESRNRLASKIEMDKYKLKGLEAQLMSNFLENNKSE